MIIELLLFLIPGILFVVLIIICCAASNNADNYDDYLYDYDRYGLYSEEREAKKKKWYKK